MLDIKLIRLNPEKVKEALKKRKEKINLDEILRHSDITSFTVGNWLKLYHLKIRMSK